MNRLFIPGGLQVATEIYCASDVTRTIYVVIDLNSSRVIEESLGSWSEFTAIRGGQAHFIS
jgi:hypothetical protein